MARKWITGIDIGHHSTKAVVLNYEATDIKIVNQLELNGCGAIFADPHTLKHQETVKKLKILRKIAPIFHKKAAVTIPASAVMSKVITLDARLAEDELEYAVHQAMNYQSPFDNDVLALDFVADCNNQPSINSENIAYHVHVTRRHTMDSWQQAVKAIGFKPELVSSNVHSLHSFQKLLLSKFPHLSRRVLIDIGHTYVSLLPPNLLPIELHKVWMLPSEDEVSLSSQASYKSAITLRLDAALLKVNTQLQLYRSMLNGKTIDGILVTGGHANDDEMISMIASRTKMTVESINNYLPSFTENQPQIGSAFVTALGTAYSAIQWFKEH